MSTIPEPQAPTFENIPSQTTFSDEYQTMLTNILKELDNSKHPHNHDVAGIALNDIIQKLMPFIQNYNMEYTQGNIANGQKAATYTLDMTNYISDQYQAVGAAKTTSDDQTYAQNAITAMTDYKNFVASTAAAAAKLKIGDPFGTMGANVEGQLENITDKTSDPGTLATYWENSWDMSSTSSPGVKGNATNSAIMQDINGAQNQAQSEAAYLQSEAKIANENYQQYTATGHDIAQNVVNVEKASVTASQSAGN
jgi:hypothetical protein